MIRLFIEKHMAVFFLSILIVVVGIYSYIKLPRESAPDIKIPIIFISTSYIGVSASDIESLITEPIETELDGMKGLEEITSSSIQNNSVIVTKFTSDIDIEEALRRTKDRVDIAKNNLPDNAEEPIVREANVSDWPVFVIYLSHPDGVEIITTAADDLQDELSRIPGVLEVTLTGKPEQELAIELDPFLMNNYGISIDDVKNAVMQEHVTIPGGTLENQEKNYAIAVTGEINDYDQFGKIMVKGSNGAAVPLEKLAHIKFQNAENKTISRFNRNSAISLNIKKRIGSNILDLADAARKKVDEFTPTLPKGTNVHILYDESRYIREMLLDLENNIFSGFVLVLIVTIFFLGFRNSLFVSMAIPFSMLLSFIVLQIVGITLNMVVLFSLIIALGMLVDNGIVIVENIYRHQAMGKSRIDSAIDGTKEVAAPITVSTLTTLLAFFPIIFMPGQMGEFMSYLPKTVIIVLSSSLLVALAINPTYCASFLKVKRNVESGGVIFTRVQNWYTSLLKLSSSRPVVTTLSITVIVIAGFVAYGFMSAETIFFPELDPDRVRISIETPQGTPLYRTDSVVNEVEKEIPGIEMSMENFEATTGVTMGDTGSNLGEVVITFFPYAQREISSAVSLLKLQSIIKQNITGAIVKIRGSESGPPSGDDISYEVRGYDYQILGQIANQLTDILSPYEDAFKTLDNNLNADLPEIAVNIDRQRTAYYGLNTTQVASAIRTAITGSKIGDFRYNNEEHDIVLRYSDDTRSSLQMLRNINVITRDGRKIPLSSIAEITPRSSLNIIERRNLNRAVSVSANFNPGYEQRSQITAEISAKVADLERDLPPGYLIGTGEGADIREESTDFLAQAFIIAVFLIITVLITQFNSLADPFIIIYSVFLSLGGVMWGFAIGGQLTGQNFVIIMSGIGSIALAGVAVNNCIVLVDYTHKLIRSGTPWSEAVVQSGRTRLRPVLLTALTTILALLPMAIGVSFDIHEFRFISGSESAEYWKSFAWTMLYGLSFATLSTLVVVPSMLSIKYKILERRKGIQAVQ